MGAKRPKSLVHLYFACLSVWVSACLYPINVKTAESIGPNFLLDLMGSQGRFMDDQIFKNLSVPKFDF